MGGVLDGQAVSAAVTNPAFLDANGDDTGVGKITLANTDPVSGPQVDNLQKEHNSAASFMGKTLNTVYNDLPTWIENQVGTGTDTLLARSEALTERFDGTTGHIHDGTDGEGAKIQAINIDQVPLQGFVQQGVDIIGVTGSSSNVTAAFTGKTSGGSASVEGVVTSGAFNKVVIRRASGINQDDVYTDANGNVVYARLTFASGTWTLSYYVLVSGTETAYSFSSASDVRYYYQETFNPLGGNAPVFSEFAVIPSDNVTADVITATTTLQGKVSLAAAAPGAIAGTGSSGTANASVANADHTHEGLHSISKSGSSQIVGDATLTGSGGVSLTQTSSNIDIAAPALSSATPSAIAATGSAGAATSSSRADHTHEGVHSVAGSGQPQITGDVTIAVSGGTSLSQASSTITLSSPSLTSTAPEDVAGAAVVGTSTQIARADHVHRGMRSVSKSGSSQLFNDVTLTGSGGTSLTQSLQNIDISSPALASTAPGIIAGTGSAGVGTSVARNDHTHEGLHSIATSGSSQIKGDATLSAGSNITLTQSLNDISIAATVPSGSTATPQDVGSTGAAGTSADYSKADHVHKGLRSLSKSGDSQLFGDVTLAAGTNVTLTQSLNQITIAATGGTAAVGVGTGGVVTPAGGSYPLTLSAADDGEVIHVTTTSARTINAFTASSGFKVTIKDVSGFASTNPITFVRSGSQKIEGLASNYLMEADYGAWTFFFDGTDWWIDI